LIIDYYTGRTKIHPGEEFIGHQNRRLWQCAVGQGSTGGVIIPFATFQPDFTFWYTETLKRAENAELYILKIRGIGSSRCNPCTLFPA
jgi:hypothetical protein